MIGCLILGYLAKADIIGRLEDNRRSDENIPENNTNPVQTP
jgi:hypothetical protein